MAFSQSRASGRRDNTTTGIEASRAAARNAVRCGKSAGQNTTFGRVLANKARQEASSEGGSGSDTHWHSGSRSFKPTATSPSRPQSMRRKEGVTATATADNSSLLLFYMSAEVGKILKKMKEKCYCGLPSQSPWIALTRNTAIWPRLVASVGQYLLSLHPDVIPNSFIFCMKGKKLSVVGTSVNSGLGEYGKSPRTGKKLRYCSAS